MMKQYLYTMVIECCEKNYTETDQVSVIIIRIQAKRNNLQMQKNRLALPTVILKTNPLPAGEFTDILQLIGQSKIMQNTDVSSIKKVSGRFIRKNNYTRIIQSVEY